MESLEAAEDTMRLIPSAANPAASTATISAQSVVESPTVSLIHVAALVIFCSLSVVICYADRANIADAILPMSEEYGWGKGITGIVLSSFFVGYASTQACAAVVKRMAVRTSRRLICACADGRGLAGGSFRRKESAGSGCDYLVLFPPPIHIPSFSPLRIIPAP